VIHAGKEFCFLFKGLGRNTFPSSCACCCYCCEELDMSLSQAVVPQPASGCHFWSRHCNCAGENSAFKFQESTDQQAGGMFFCFVVSIQQAILMQCTGSSFQPVLCQPMGFHVPSLFLPHTSSDINM
jgi:hypothetical protein